MKIEVFSNNRSVRPFTTWTSLADMYNYLEENKVIENVCDKVFETGDKTLKSKLPAIMPMGNIGDKQRKKENCMPTGLVMIDIDGKEPVNIEEAKKYFEERHQILIENYVRLIHVTPSGMGLRVLACCHYDGMEGTINRLTEKLELTKYGSVDPACKDLSRLSYLVPSKYLIFVDEKMFDDVPQESIDYMKKYQWTGTAPNDSNTNAQIGELEANIEKFKTFEYNGVPLAQIVKDYIADTGGEPAKGARHTFYNQLIVLFRNLADNQPKILHACIPMFGLPIDETWKQCVGLTQSNKQFRIDGRLYYWLKNRGLLAERTRIENEDEHSEEPLPPMPKLPPIFRQYVNSAPDDFKIPTIVALLPILGTLTSHLRATYFDDSEQSTEFISLLFAPPSSGKSFIKRLSVLLKNLRDRDELANAREELYAMSERKKGANDKGEDAPKVSVRIVKPLISVPELLTKMRYNQGHHMYIEAEELDTFAKGNRGAGGDKSDLWRVTWDNGWYGQYYKSVNTFKGEVQMFMNLLFTSTQDQIDRFFKNVEDGLVTRFSVCPIENQTFAKFTPWKPMPKKDKLQIQNILDRLEMKNYKMPLKFDKDDLIDIKAEDFDKVVPWQYEFQPFEHIDLSYIYQTLLDWLEQERLKSAQTLNEARDVFRRRAAVKGFRLAMVCHGLYANVGKKEQNIIKDFVKWFCTVDLRNSLYQFGEKYNELQQSVKKVNVPHNAIYEKMAETFTKNDLRIALQKAYIKTPLRAVVSLWYKNKLIEKRGDEFVKINKKKNDKKE